MQHNHFTVQKWLVHKKKIECNQFHFDCWTQMDNEEGRPEGFFNNTRIYVFMLNRKLGQNNKCLSIFFSRGVSVKNNPVVLNLIKIL